MGSEFDGDYKLLSNPTIGMPGLAMVAAELADSYGLIRSAALELLIDYIFGLSCRDQDQDQFELGTGAPTLTLSERRSRGYVLAKRMREDALTIISCLENIYANMDQFNHEVVRDNPALLEAIFDVDCGSPANAVFPEELSSLQTFLCRATDDDVERVTAEMKVAGGEDAKSESCLGFKPDQRLEREWVS